jgi:hypothetical protein
MSNNNSNANFSENLDHCLALEMKNEAWYKGTKYDRRAAWVHKQLFLQGKLPYEIKKIYLQNLGYKIIQVELWEKEITSPIVTNTELISEL